MELGIARIVELNTWWSGHSFSEVKYQVFGKWISIWRHKNLVSESKCFHQIQKNLRDIQVKIVQKVGGFLCLCGVLFLVCVFCGFPLQLQDFKILSLNGKLQSHECHLYSLSPPMCAYCGKWCWKPPAVYGLWTLFTEKLPLLISGDRPKNGTCSGRGLDSSENLK